MSEVAEWRREIETSSARAEEGEEEVEVVNAAAAAAAADPDATPAPRVDRFPASPNEIEKGCGGREVKYEICADGDNWTISVYILYYTCSKRLDRQERSGANGVNLDAYKRRVPVR